MGPMDEFGAVTSLAASQHGVVSRDQARSCGLSDRAVDRLVRSRRWAKVRPNVYRVEPGPLSLAARVKAVQLVLGPRAVAVGPTAARLWGMQGPMPGPGYEHVHVSAPGRGSGASAGVRRHGWDVPAGETTVRGGLRLTTPGRTVRDTVLLTDRYSAVSVVDSALNLGLVDPGDLPELAAANAGRVGARRSRAWWTEADGRAESTFETRLRLVLTDRGLAPQELQYPVFTSAGDLAGRADLAWPDHGVVAEADGAGPHTLPEALFTDRERHNRMATAPGRLVLLRFTWSDLRHPDQIAEMVRAALTAPAPMREGEPPSGERT